MSSYSIVFPPDFADNEWEAETKGWFGGVAIVASGRRYCVTFYDATRLFQDIESELANADAFFERNLVVVKSVTRQEMERAVEKLARIGLLASLVPDP